jgi:hypothetical protein
MQLSLTNYKRHDTLETSKKTSSCLHWTVCRPFFAAPCASLLKFSKLSASSAASRAPSRIHVHVQALFSHVVQQRFFFYFIFSFFKNIYPVSNFDTTGISHGDWVQTPYHTGHTIRRLEVLHHFQPPCDTTFVKNATIASPTTVPHGGRVQFVFKKS